MQPRPTPAPPAYRLRAGALTIRTLVCLLALSMLGGCAGLQRGVPGFGSVRHARSLERAGQYRQAAQAYEALASRASGTQRPDFLLSAAHAWTAAGEPATARRILAAVHVPATAAALGARRSLVLAEIDLAQRQPLRALSDSAGLTAQQLSPELQLRLYRLRADAYLQAGNPLESVRARVALEPLLKEPQAIRNNQERIWHALGQLTTPALEQLSNATPVNTLGGWLALAELARTAQGNPEAFRRGLAAWEQQYPHHPATRILVPQLLRFVAAARGYPARVALLLPLRGGPYAEAARAVLDGFMTAYYKHTGTSAPTVIRVYDTGDQPADAVQAYQRAVRDGAGFVVGPLRKEAVAALAAQPPGPVPVLALNYLKTGTKAPADLYQFGLSPEQEARQAAERAWLDGRSHALVLVPDGPWGTRVAQAFERSWQRLGGTTLDQQSYDPTHTDFSGPILRLLNLNRSRARYRALRALLHRNLQFTPRRRQDADFIFLAAYPRDARLIRPQLRFHHAAALPVYATSHVYAGVPDPARNRDLDGIRFCDMPWILAPGPAQKKLRTQLAHLWPDESRSLSPLEALGVDAYRLIPQLPALAKNPFARYQGATGSLSLSAAGRIYRGLLWAEFHNGVPKLLDQVTPAPASGKSTATSPASGAPAPASSPASSPTSSPAASPAASPATGSATAGSPAPGTAAPSPGASTPVPTAP